MYYIIYQNGSYINTISASADFVETYCEKHSYTYEEVEMTTSEVEVDVWTELAQAITEGVNSI